MKPRHYILVAVLIGVAIFDYFHVRKQREHQLVITEQPAPVVVNGVPTTPGSSDTTSPASDAWLAYEHASNLRDAPPPDFTPAISRFETAKAGVPAAPGTYDAQDLDTCRMWLLQYRKGGTMKSMSAKHIDDCARLHRDVAN